MSGNATLLDLGPSRRVFLKDVLSGLCRRPKHLPCKYFYDHRGSKLFDQICSLEEYYLTRTELAIMKESAAEMAIQIGPQAMLVELGSGSSVKTQMLLDHLQELVAYVPVDISRKHLAEVAERLSGDYRSIQVLPVCADFTQSFQLPIAERSPSHVVVYFPGSTIGNFRPAETQQLLRGMRELCGESGGLLIGIDLQKDPSVIEAAYNDRQGITARFNLNLLRRINRELGGDFQVEQFRHRALYNPQAGRVEISVVSQSDQLVTVGGESVRVAAGEAICTEYSYKYTIEGFACIAEEADFSLQRHWVDRNHYFAVLYLASAAGV